MVNRLNLRESECINLILISEPGNLLRDSIFVDNKLELN